MMKPNVLLVDDDAQFRDEMVLALGSSFRLREAASGAKALESARREIPDAVLLDVNLGDMSGIEVLKGLRALIPEVPILMLSVLEEVETVVSCMKAGAWHYVPKSAPITLLRESLQKAIDQGRAERERMYLEAELAEATEREAGKGELIGESECMKRLRHEIGEVGPTSVDVLITGESGTGKELVAGALHECSGRAGSFVPVDLLGVPSQLADSRLFGHEKGAFTGASERRIGAFEAAAGGTVFLDEIGDISAEVQPKLLRVLQERMFQRLGGESGIRADVRVIAATNKQLEKLVTSGVFRDDLYHRIDVFRINVPPLRERLDDIPRLAHHFLIRHRRTVAKNITGVREDALELLRRHNWPGNVRELQNKILSGMVRCKGEEITAEDLVELAGSRLIDADATTPYEEARDRALREFKKDYLRSALETAGGVVNVAARNAGLSPPSFRRMLRECGLR